MEKNKNKNIFNPNQLEKLDKFAELIYFENKKYNLTGLKNIKDIKDILIDESITTFHNSNISIDVLLKF